MKNKWECGNSFLCFKIKKLLGEFNHIQEEEEEEEEELQLRKENTAPNQLLINPLKYESVSDLKTHFVPRSKHFLLRF